MSTFIIVKGMRMRCVGAYQESGELSLVDHYN